VLQNLSAGTVVSVTVGALPAACGGATLQATVNNGVTITGTGLPYLLAPLAAILILTLGVVLIVDALDEVFNPRLRAQ